MAPDKRNPDFNPSVSSAAVGDASNLTSISLLDRARGGDADAWRRLVRLYSPLVLHWCRRWNVRGADADDVTQEVFHSASIGLNDFRRERAGDTFRGWLRAITRNKLADHLRRRNLEPPGTGGSTLHQRLQQVPGGLVSAMGDGEDEVEDAFALGELFERAFHVVRSEFERHTWDAFWRTTVDNQRSIDVAIELGLRSAAVRMAKCRVLRRVREELGELVG